MQGILGILRALDQEEELSDKDDEQVDLVLELALILSDAISGLPMASYDRIETLMRERKQDLTCLELALRALAEKASRQ